MTPLGNFVIKTEVKERRVTENKTNKMKSRVLEGEITGS